MEIVENLLKLPSRVYFEGVTFFLSIEKIEFDSDKNKNYFILSYDILNAKKDSKHYNDVEKYGAWLNPFDDNYCGFLIFRNFSTDEQLLVAIQEILNFIENEVNKKSTN